MESLRALLATNDRQTLEFFFVSLKEVCGTGVDTRELLYVASVLAHYAQVSTAAPADVPAPRTLLDVFEQFVIDQAAQQDGALLETAAAQCLLLAGFFEAQMRGRHNIRWYADLGAGYFRRAATLEPSRPEADLLDTVGRHFEPWRVRYARLSEELRLQRYVIVPASPESDN